MEVSVMEKPSGGEGHHCEFSRVFIRINCRCSDAEGRSVLAKMRGHLWATQALSQAEQEPKL